MSFYLRQMNIISEEVHMPFSNHDFLLRETAGNLKDNGYLFASTPYYDESQQYIANVSSS